MIDAHRRLGLTNFVPKLILLRPGRQISGSLAQTACLLGQSFRKTRGLPETASFVRHQFLRIAVAADEHLTLQSGAAR